MKQIFPVLYASQFSDTVRLFPDVPYSQDPESSFVPLLFIAMAIFVGTCERHAKPAINWLCPKQGWSPIHYTFCHPGQKSTYYTANKFWFCELTLVMSRYSLRESRKSDPKLAGSCPNYSEALSVTENISGSPHWKCIEHQWLEWTLPKWELNSILNFKTPSLRRCSLPLSP